MTDLDTSSPAPQLIAFLRERFPALPEDFDTEAPLLDSGAIDSLGIVEIVAFLEERFGLVLGDDDLSPARFASVATLLDGFGAQVHAG